MSNKCEPSKAAPALPSEGACVESKLSSPRSLKDFCDTYKGKKQVVASSDSACPCPETTTTRASCKYNFLKLLHPRKTTNMRQNCCCPFAELEFPCSWFASPKYFHLCSSRRCCKETCHCTDEKKLCYCNNNSGKDVGVTISTNTLHGIRSVNDLRAWSICCDDQRRYFLEQMLRAGEAIERIEIEDDMPQEASPMQIKYERLINQKDEEIERLKKKLAELEQLPPPPPRKTSSPQATRQQSEQKTPTRQASDQSSPQKGTSKAPSPKASEPISGPSRKASNTPSSSSASPSRKPSNPSAPPSRQASEVSPPSTKQSDLPPSTRQSDLPPSTRESDLPPSTRQSDLPPSTRQSDLPPSTRQSDLPPSPKQSDLPPSAKQSELPPSRTESDHPPPSTKQSELPPSTKQSELPPSRKESDPRSAEVEVQRQESQPFVTEEEEELFEDDEPAESETVPPPPTPEIRNGSSGLSISPPPAAPPPPPPIEGKSTPNSTPPHAPPPPPPGMESPETTPENVEKKGFVCSTCDSPAPCARHPSAPSRLPTEAVGDTGFDEDEIENPYDTHVKVEGNKIKKMKGCEVIEEMDPEQLVAELEWLRESLIANGQRVHELEDALYNGSEYDMEDNYTSCQLKSQVNFLRQRLGSLGADILEKENNERQLQLTLETTAAERNEYREESERYRILLGLAEQTLEVQRRMIMEFEAGSGDSCNPCGRMMQQPNMNFPDNYADSFDDSANWN